MKRTKTVTIGSVKIGSRHPVRIKGMLKTPTARVKKLIKEAQQLEAEGAESIRLAVKTQSDARLPSLLKKQLTVPLVADVHFQYMLALAALEGGFDGIRLNPLNITKKSHVQAVVAAAQKRKVSIRVGVNSGGFKKGFSSPKALASHMVDSVGRYVKIMEKEGFSDIMVSLKGSDIASTVCANQLFAQQFNYPLHLGITAAGPFLDGVIKSSTGLGILLSQGIGNVIRVSLTAPSFWEIRVAKQILSSLQLRTWGPQIISCPTCSRCEVDLTKITKAFKEKLDTLNIEKPLQIALMGCVVNGPGEAAQADIGVAFGKKRAAIFRKNKVLRQSNDSRVINDLLSEVRKLWM